MRTSMFKSRHNSNSYIPVVVLDALLSARASSFSAAVPYAALDNLLQALSASHIPVLVTPHSHSRHPCLPWHLHFPVLHPCRSPVRHPCGPPAVLCFRLVPPSMESWGAPHCPVCRYPQFAWYYRCLWRISGNTLILGKSWQDHTFSLYIRYC
jgi:hypothetical protein